MLYFGKQLLTFC